MGRNEHEEVSGEIYLGECLMWEARIRKELMGKKDKDPIGLGGGEKIKRTRERKNKENEKEESQRAFSLDLRRVLRVRTRRTNKSVYSMRAKLQEVGILPTLFISNLMAVWPDF